MTSYDLRDDLHRLVVAELLGPAGGPAEYCFERSAHDRYLVGLLAPQGQSVLPEEADEAPVADVDGEDGLTEAPPPKAASILPSSLGMTFVVAGDALALQITARWDRYRRGLGGCPGGAATGKASAPLNMEMGGLIRDRTDGKR